MHFGGLKAVSEVSFEVEEGSITALIGPNGAGKTTLFNAVSRLQKMAGGRIWFGDTEITKLDAAATARLGMARTFQNLRIFVNMSVLDNVLVGCHRHEKSGFWSGGLGFPRRGGKRSGPAPGRWMRSPWSDCEQQAELPAASLPVRSAAPGGDREGARVGAASAPAGRAGGGHQPERARRPGRAHRHDPRGRGDRAHRGARHGPGHGHLRQGERSRLRQAHRLGHAGHECSRTRRSSRPTWAPSGARGTSAPLATWSTGRAARCPRICWWSTIWSRPTVRSRRFTASRSRFPRAWW